MLTMENMMIKFLKKCYPVQRIKINRQFKRAIILDNGEQCQISGANIKNIYSKLFIILNQIFSEDKELTDAVLKQFLHMK
jgi:hypothetical protein